MIVLKTKLEARTPSVNTKNAAYGVILPPAGAGLAKPMSTTRFTSGENQLMRRPAQTARRSPFLTLDESDAPSAAFCFALNASALQTMDATMIARPVQISQGLPFPSTNQLATVPPTSASPTPTGNATDIPATAIAADRRMFEALKTMPPRKGHIHCEAELVLRFSTKLHAPPPREPIVKPARSAKMTSPRT